MLEDTVPHFYIQLHDIIRELAHKCHTDGIVPIYTDQEYQQAVQLQCELLLQQGKPAFTGPEKMRFSISQLHEASTFLHNDGKIVQEHKVCQVFDAFLFLSIGMLFQYEDSAKNEYIYCVNPQWLCLTLTKVISEKQEDLHFKNGESFTGSFLSTYLCFHSRIYIP